MILDWETASFLFDQVLLPLIALYLLAKALLLRRQTPLGVALARCNVAFAIAFLGVAASPWIGFFATAVWSWTARLAILITAHLAMVHLVRVGGGWRATAREAARSLGEERAWVLLLAVGLGVGIWVSHGLGY